MGRMKRMKRMGRRVEPFDGDFRIEGIGKEKEK